MATTNDPAWARAPLSRVRTARRPALATLIALALALVLAACASTASEADLEGEPLGALMVAAAVSETASALSGTTVSGSVYVFVESVGWISEVRFYADGVEFGRVGASPFGVHLDTTRLADGPHVLRVEPRMKNGRVRDASDVGFVVDNTTVPAPPVDEPVEPVDPVDPGPIDPAPPEPVDPVDPVDPGPTDPAPPEPPVAVEALLVLGAGGVPNAHEVALVDRLELQGWTVTLVSDAAVTTAMADASDLVLMSKTVHSTTVGTKLKGTTTGVIFWEDNQQRLQMMATIANDGSGGTTWHSTRHSVDVDAAAPSELRAGLSGVVRFYTREDEITWAPRQNGPSELTEDAIKVARIASSGTEYRYAIYAYESGGRLADGTRAAGRRVYFGLYDATFGILTEPGLALWDAAITWAAAGE